MTQPFRFLFLVSLCLLPVTKNLPPLQYAKTTETVHMGRMVVVDESVTVKNMHSYRVNVIGAVREKSGGSECGILLRLTQGNTAFRHAHQPDRAEVKTHGDAFPLAGTCREAQLSPYGLIPMDGRALKSA